MRRSLLSLLLLLSIGLGTSAAVASPLTSTAPASMDRRDSEIYVPVGLAFFSSPNRLAVGLGGGLGYRYLINSTWSVYSEMRIGWYTGVVGLLTTGATVGFYVRSWNPQLGLGGLLFLGDSIRVLSSTSPEVPEKAAAAISVRLMPLRFVRERFYGSALTVDVGCGIARGGCALALAVSILEAGVRF